MDELVFLKQGFLKGAEELGYDKYAVAGFMDVFDHVVVELDNIVKEAELASGDPSYRIKLARELIKQAEGEQGSQIWNSLRPYLGDIGGGLGGGLLGLLGGSAMDHPFLGMLLGALTGAAGHHYWPQISSWGKGLMHPQAPQGAPAQPAPNPSQPSPHMPGPMMNVQTPPTAAPGQSIKPPMANMTANPGASNPAPVSPMPHAQANLGADFDNLQKQLPQLPH